MSSDQQQPGQDPAVEVVEQGPTTAVPALAKQTLIVPSLSRASDAGHLATRDIADITGELDLDYRLVGGNAVTLLTWHHGVQDLVPGRETADSDLGASPELIGAPGFTRGLAEREYRRSGGNTFVRTIEHAGHRLDLSIDVLAPGDSDRLISNRPIGPLHVDEVPGLGFALARSPTVVEVEATLTTGEVLTYAVCLSEVRAAICMKAFAYQGRLLARDAVDIWRLLEAANAAGHTSETWPSSITGRKTSALLSRHFGSPRAGGTKQASSDRADQARIRSLVSRLVGVQPDI